MSSVVPVVDDVRVDFAAFDGTLLACLAFGALMILYIQLIQVLRGRPKRSGCIFWGIVVYSSALFPLATLAVIGKIKFAEVVYVTNRLYTSGPKAYYIAHSEMWPNVMAQVSTTVLPWIADILMLYRLTVFLELSTMDNHLSRVTLPGPRVYLRSSTHISDTAKRHSMAIPFANIQDYLSFSMRFPQPCIHHPDLLSDLCYAR